MTAQTSARDTESAIRSEAIHLEDKPVSHVDALLPTRHSLMEPREAREKELH